MKITFLIGTILTLWSCSSEPQKGIGRNRSDTTIALDTYKEQETSVSLTWDTSTYNLNSSYASLWNNQLEIIFSDTGYRVLGLAIGLKGKTTKPKVVKVQQDISPTDCLYVSQTFKLLYEEIDLNKHEYKKGDLISGSIDLLLLGRKDMIREPLVAFVDKRKWDTVRLVGSFSSQVH